MIAFQIIGGLVTGVVLVALVYERITTGTLEDADGSEIPPRHQVNMILLMLVLFIAIVGPALMPAKPGFCL